MSPDEKPGAHVHHVYDGIVEEDNHLPNWWLAILFGTIVFGFGYWFVFETTQALPNPVAAYKLETAELARLHPESMPMTNDALLALGADPAIVAEGQQAYATTCVACHLAKGEGLVGPNLTDGVWMHGGKPLDIHTAISNGFPEKGMPPWIKTLGPAKVRALTAFVLSMKGRNIPGKAPQGEPE
jgi:cytochrome c oxidase cbb3-type subunit 3